MKSIHELESIKKELNLFGKNLKEQNEIGLGAEFEETAEAIQYLANVYNYGYEGYEIDIWNKHISQKLSSLKRVIKVKSSQTQTIPRESILGALTGYENTIKHIN
ncbi:MAG: hypothetical protein K0R26_427 [Bacteroidota bacterium]|jgi:hypothetical protein|nr:hypothetical protein [Bacteroidota bacterium]